MNTVRHRVVVDDSALAGRIGGRIRVARRAAGLTQQQLAEGRYTKAYISALEKGHAKPSMAALDFISGRLGIPASRFLADETPRWSRIEADLLLASGRWDEAAAAYDSVLEAARDPGARAEALRGRAEALCRQEQGRAAIAPAMESAELFERQGRGRDAALATYWLAYAQHLAGNPEEARDLLSGLLKVVRRPSPEGDPDLHMRALMALGSVVAAQDDHAASLAYLEEARVLAVDLDQWRRAAYLSLVAASSIEAGDTEGAIRAGVESLALFRSAEAERERAILENNLALAYLGVGNLTRAGELAAEARQRHQLDGDRRSLAHVVETEARIALAQGDAQRAEALAMEAVGHARESDNQRALASGLLTVARAQAVADRTDEAIASYATAVDLLREHGPGPRLQQALAEWADLLARLGRHAEAYELTREALGVVRTPPRPARPPARARRAARGEARPGGPLAGAGSPDTRPKRTSGASPPRKATGAS